MRVSDHPEQSRYEFVNAGCNRCSYRAKAVAWRPTLLSRPSGIERSERLIHLRQRIISISMIVNDLDIGRSGTPFRPSETYAPLTIDTDGILS